MKEQKSFKKVRCFFWEFEINALSLQNISGKNGNKHKCEFFERFKINKQVVQAGAPYVIYIWCTEKTRTVNIDIDRFGILEQIIN